MAALPGTENVTPTLPSSGVKASMAVLLAEDSHVTQDLLTFLLTKWGHRVDVADDGEQALKALQSRSYDIALMDFHLPKMDGLRVVAKFRSMAGGTAKLPHFIGITADIEGLLAHPDNCESFDLVIAKPIDIVHLRGVVENFEHYMAWTRGNAIDQGVIQPFPVILADDRGSESQGSSASPLAAGNDGRRRHKRMKVERGTTGITLRNGDVYDCEVLDLSLSGAALRLKARPAIGESVRVGRTEGRVVRHTSEGVAVEFAGAPSLTLRRK